MNINLALRLLIALSFINSPAGHSQPPLPNEEPISSTQDFPEKYLLGQLSAERIDKRTGNLFIKHHDVSLPGNGGLDVNIYRVYDLQSIGQDPYHTHRQSGEWAMLGLGWKINVSPRIKVLKHYIIGTNGGSGVFFNQGENFKAMCSDTIQKGNYFSLELPDGTTQNIEWTDDREGRVGKTKENWRVYCVGKDVFANSPDGKTYEFGDYSTDMRTITYQNGNGPSSPYSIPGQYLLAKKEIDVFGNWIIYQHENHSIPSARIINESPSFRPTSIKTSDGKYIKFIYDKTTGRLRRIADSTGKFWEYDYYDPDMCCEPASNNIRRLKSFKGPTGDITRFEYYYGVYGNGDPNSQRLRKIIYPTGGSENYKYLFYKFSDNNYYQHLYERRVSAVQRSDGYFENYNYTTGSTGVYDTTSVTNNAGTWTYKYVGIRYAKNGYLSSSSGKTQFSEHAWKVGQLREIISPLGQITRYKYEKKLIGDRIYTIRTSYGTARDRQYWRSNLTEVSIIRDGALYETRYQDHDYYGNPYTIEEKGPNGGYKKTRFTYFNDPLKWIIGVVEHESKVDGSILRSIDANGMTIAKSVNGVIWRYSYDDQGNIESVTDPNGAIKNFLSYKCGIPQEEVQPLNTRITRIVSNDCNITRETNGEGASTGYKYDKLGRVTKIIPPIGAETNIEYTTNSKTTKRGNFVEKIDYDDFGRTSKITVAGQSVNYQHDPLGRISYISNIGDTSAATRYHYDALNRNTQIVFQNGEKITKSYHNGYYTKSDENGNLTRYTFKAYGSPDENLITKITPSIPDYGIDISRDFSDRITKLKMGSMERFFEYDSRGYLIKETHTDLGIIDYNRDDLGNIISMRRNNGETSHYRYDLRGRLTVIDHPGETEDIYRYYNRLDLLIQESNSLSSRSYNYDLNKNLTDESIKLGSNEYKFSYSYDNLDHLSSITYPVSKKKIEFYPDQIGRPSRVGELASNVRYWPSGQLKELHYNNGTATRYDQDNRYRPTSIEAFSPSSALVEKFHFYDKTGNLTLVEDRLNNLYNATYKYDSLNQIVSATGYWGKAYFSHDFNGNMIQKKTGPNTTNFNYHSGKLISSTAGRYEYDNNGNISRSPRQSYRYNSANKLDCVNCGSPSQVKYWYDSAGYRAGISSISEESQEIYDHQGILRMKTWTSDGVKKYKEYYYLKNMRIADRIFR